MLDTPRANRLHIAIFGKRNAGKSSLINAITGQKIALVSEHAGTTTDPVYKAMELLPIGPIVMIDTAGLDDKGSLGELRVQKTKEVMDKADLALLVFTPENNNFDLENEWYNELKLRKIPTIGVINKCEGQDINIEAYEENFEIPFVKVSAKEGINIGKLKEKIQENAPLDFERETILGDIIKPKDLVLLVAPQDIQAPKGRLILPQVQVLRDVLDNHAQAFTVTDAELKDALDILNKKPDLVVTDSQVFKKVNDLLPADVELTSFSILMARYKGELEVFVKGAKAIENLKTGDKVLIAEACTHHALKGDIGREKLPNWLESLVGGKLDITVNAGVDFPEDLSEYKLIIHCGACMFNRKQLMSRVMRAMDQNVPITNYGIAIAQINGILDRTTRMFKLND
jgi:[FeFe] hydrogenase H-cluster maturation GTPase HydF